MRNLLFLSLISMEFLNKKIAVLGIGVEGLSVVNFLINNGVRDVTVFEERRKEGEIESFNFLKSRGVNFVFGKFSQLEKFDIIFRSPGVIFHHDEIEKAKKKGVEISSSTKLFFKLCKGQIIGVTGTKGKGTTSTLIFEMLKAQGKHVFLGGNVGVAPLDFLSEVTPKSFVVLELSSFQLEDLNESPHIAVILMVTSEHLDHHRDTNEYVEAKRNILRFQSPLDFAIVNKDYPASNESDIYSEGEVFQISRETAVEKGAYVKEGFITTKINNVEEKIISTKDIFIPGSHNYENVCAAVMAAKILGVDENNIVKTLKNFRGLPHRIELVAEIRGVKYYDDSFSTTPESTIAAIEAFDAPEILILGGSSKGSDFTELAEVIKKSSNIKTIIGIGVEWEKIKEKLRVDSLNIRVIEGAKSMKEIVGSASKEAMIGDVVLLSPACASFGMFANYKDRGDQFKKEVLVLRN